MIKKKYIVGIFDIETTTGSNTTKAFLSNAQKKGRIVPISTDLPRTFIVYNEKGKTLVYLSPLSSATLKKRNQIKNVFKSVS